MKDRIGHLSRRSGGLVRLPGACRRPVIAAVAAVTLVIATLASVSATTTTAASATGRPAYLDPPFRSRRGSTDLLSRMTLPEKIGQMVQIEATQVTDTTSTCTSTGGFNVPNPACEQKIFVDDNAARSWPAEGTSRRTPPAKAAPATPAWTGPTSTTRCSPTRSTLAAAHPRDLRRRRCARVRPSVPGAAVPAVHRDGRDLGSGRRQAGGASDRQRAACHRLGVGLRARPRPGAGQPVGPRLRDLVRGTRARRGDGRRVRPRGAEHRRRRR